MSVRDATARQHQLFEPAVVPHRRRHVGRKLPGGLCRNVFDRSANLLRPYRVPCRPRSTSMRSTSTTSRNALRPAEIDVVQIDPDTRLEESDGIDLADAAKVDNGIVRVADVDAQVRHQGLQVADVGDLQVFERARREGRHRDRHILQIGVTPLGGECCTLSEPRSMSFRHRSSPPARTDTPPSPSPSADCRRTP